jgi:hypothetical protein
MTLADHVPIRDGELIAAVDMGSNSFHMVVARVEHGEPRVIDRLRDTVRMAAGLRGDGTGRRASCPRAQLSQASASASLPSLRARRSHQHVRRWPHRRRSSPRPRLRSATRWKWCPVARKAA